MIFMVAMEELRSDSEEMKSKDVKKNFVTPMYRKNRKKGRNQPRPGNLRC
jgi:hypothetical protein